MKANVNHVFEFEQFYADNYPAVVRRCARRFPQDAEDLAQLAMVRAYEHWSNFIPSVGETSRAHWLNRIVTNILTDQARTRSRSRRTTVLHDWLASPERVEAADLQLDIAQALRTLPPRQRRLLLGFHYLGLPVADLARLEGAASVDGTKKALHRARAACARALQRYQED